MDRKDELIVDLEAILDISVKSLRKGTPAGVLESTLKKIGLSKKEAKEVVNKAREEVKKREAEDRD